MLNGGQTPFTETSSVNHDKNKRFNLAFVPGVKNKIKVKSFSYFVELIKRSKRYLLYD